MIDHHFCSDRCYITWPVKSEVPFEWVKTMNIILVVGLWAVAVTAEFKLDPMCTEMPSPPVVSSYLKRVM